MPLDTFPTDEVALEQALAARIRDELLAVPIIDTYIKNVYVEERYPDNEEEDITISTVDDQVVGSRVKRTSIIEIGLPQVEEFEYTNDQNTQLNFIYPITFNYEVVDRWKDPNDVLEYKSSRALVMAVYMRARKALKRNRTLGFEKCVHDYLQQVDAGTVADDDETGGRLHVLEWSLTVHCMDIRS